MESEYISVWKIVSIEKVTKNMKYVLFSLFMNEKRNKSITFLDFLSTIEKKNVYFYFFYYIETEMPKGFFAYEKTKFGNKILLIGYNRSSYIKEEIFIKIIEKFKEPLDNFYIEVTIGYFKEFLKHGVMPICDNVMLYNLTEGKYTIYKKSSIVEITDNKKGKKMNFFFGNPKVERSYIEKEYVRD
jgi:hypothetical protein